MALAGESEVICGTGLTEAWMVIDLCSSSPWMPLGFLSRTERVKVELPTAVGVPVICPVLLTVFRLSPAGSEPRLTDHPYAWALL